MKEKMTFTTCDIKIHEICVATSMTLTYSRKSKFELFNNIKSIILLEQTKKKILSHKIKIKFYMREIYVAQIFCVRK